MWRKIESKDVQRGVCVNPFGAADTSPYSVGTIIAVSKDNEVTIARPMAYASEVADNKCPMLYAETFTVSKVQLLECGATVWEDAHSKRVRECVT